MEREVKMAGNCFKNSILCETGTLLSSRVFMVKHIYRGGHAMMCESWFLGD